MNARTCKRLAVARPRGFTLMEVLIVMVVIGILTAIAVPNYSEYVRRGHRATAQEFLVSAASRQAQYYLDRRAFAPAICWPADAAGDCLRMGNPAAEIRVDASQPKTGLQRYEIAVNSVAGPPAQFTVTATPVGNQTGDRCGALTIDNTGARGATAAGLAVTGCW